MVNRKFPASRAREKTALVRTRAGPAHEHNRSALRAAIFIRFVRGKIGDCRDYRTRRFCHRFGAPYGAFNDRFFFPISIYQYLFDAPRLWEKACARAR